MARTGIRWIYIIAVLLLVCGVLLAGCTTSDTTKGTTATPEIKTKVIVDQLGRNVTVPANVTRVVSLQHHTIDIIIELNGQDKLVGVLKSWQTYLPPGIKRVYPRIESLPTPGDLTSANVEELLTLHPDVVFVPHQMPKAEIDRIQGAGIPVVAIALFDAEYNEASKLNPNLTNPDKAYTEGLKHTITIIGDTIGKETEARELIAYTYKNRDFVLNRTAPIPRSERVTVYNANPDLYTYGTGKYTGVMIDRAGGVNVAENINGYKQVTMEEVLKWNPEVIIIQDRYVDVAATINSDPAWAPITAVKNKKVIITPEYVKPWGHATPESMALGELWMAKTLYPDKFADVDMDTMANEFYQKFYRVPYIP